MQSFIFNCPGCNHGIEVQEDWQGKAVKCPHCGLSVVVPAKSMYTTTNATPEVTEMADTAPSTEIKVMCPECNANYVVGKSLSNTLITCPQCGTKVTVPPYAEFETISCPYCNMIGYVDKSASTVRCFACKKTFSLNCDLPIAAEQKLPAVSLSASVQQKDSLLFCYLCKRTYYGDKKDIGGKVFCPFCHEIIFAEQSKETVFQENNFITDKTLTFCDVALFIDAKNQMLAIAQERKEIEFIPFEKIIDWEVTSQTKSHITGQSTGKIDGRTGNAIAGSIIGELIGGPAGGVSGAVIGSAGERDVSMRVDQHVSTTTYYKVAISINDLNENSIVIDVGRDGKLAEILPALKYIKLNTTMQNANRPITKVQFPVSYYSLEQARIAKLKKEKKRREGEIRVWIFLAVFWGLVILGIIWLFSSCSSERKRKSYSSYQPTHPTHTNFKFKNSTLDAKERERIYYSDPVNVYNEMKRIERETYGQY